ncbi:MAG: inositol monophosphatase [Clostridiaceae bacterium]|nr:inositol monophosphatase [Clostridiaceae bacterium]
MLSKIIDAVREAGKLILNADDIEVASKDGGANYVTKYDFMVQEFLCKRLKEIVPDAGFVGEEGSGGHEKAGDGYCFIIDPIDGTTNFICNYKLIAVSVGLALDGEPVLGVVYNPYLDEMFYAEKGKGAYLNGKKLIIKDRSLNEGLLCFNSSPYNKELRETLFKLLKELSYQAVDIREIGTAALSICYVADNRNAAYFSLALSVWDYAAAAVIVREAGGELMTVNGENIGLYGTSSLVAANRTAMKEFFAIAEKVSLA